MSNNQLTANIVLVSNVIFSSKEEKPFAGFIAIKDKRIVAIGNQNEQAHWIGPETKVYRLGDQLVMPGIHDNHVFFTGYMSMNRGVDLSNASSEDEAITLLIEHSKRLGPSENIYGFGWDKESLGCIPQQNQLDEIFPDQAAIAINRTKSWCWMNQTAIDKYKLTPDQCSAEERAELLKDMLKETEKVKEEFLSFGTGLAELR